MRPSCLSRSEADEGTLPWLSRWLMGTVKLKAVSSSSTTEHADASWHHPADHPHSDACRCAAHLGLQPELGLCPERRAGSDRRDPDHPLADGPPLMAGPISTQAKGA